MDWLQRLFPAVDPFDDLVGAGGPDEGFWILVVLGTEAIDGGLEIDDGMEHTAFQVPFRELGEEALDGIEPGGRDRREVEMEPWMRAPTSSRTRSARCVRSPATSNAGGTPRWSSDGPPPACWRPRRPSASPQGLSFSCPSSETLSGST